MKKKVKRLFIKKEGKNRKLVARYVEWEIPEKETRKETYFDDEGGWNGYYLQGD